MITFDQLMAIGYPNKEKIQSLVDPINFTLEYFDITPGNRENYFLAQCAHESGGFRYLEELWGPTKQQNKYDPPFSLSKKLGNTEPGDGVLFKGRGIIQLTGRYNYEEFFNWLGLDYEPEELAKPELAAVSAGWYWYSKGLNELADNSNFKAITKKINGGTIGYESRLRYLDKIENLLR